MRQSDTTVSFSSGTDLYLWGVYLLNMAASVFDAIEAALPTEGEGLKGQIRGNIQFSISGVDYHLALRADDEPAAITRGIKDADLTVTVDEKVFLQLCSGELSPVNAFMSQKVRVKGKMPLAMKLEKILALARPRAKL